MSDFHRLGYWQRGRERWAAAISPLNTREGGVGTRITFPHRERENTMREMTGLNELRERGMMTWLEQEHGWVEAPEEIVKAFSKDGFEECNRETTTSRRDLQSP